MQIKQTHDVYIYVHELPEKPGLRWPWRMDTSSSSPPYFVAVWTSTKSCEVWKYSALSIARNVVFASTNICSTDSDGQYPLPFAVDVGTLMEQPFCPAYKIVATLVRVIALRMQKDDSETYKQILINN